MDKGKMLWTVLGFGIALCVVGVAAYFWNSDGQPEEEEEPVQPKGGVYLMMVEGLEGEVQDKDHEGWMILDSFALPSIKVTPGGLDRVSGERTYEPIRVVKRIDKSSPKLMESCVKGQLLPKLVIRYCHITQENTLRTIVVYEFTNVAIMNYVSGAGQGESVPTEEFQAPNQPQYQYSYDVGKGWNPDRPTESISLNFEELKMIYTEYDREGSSKGNVETEFKVEEGET